MDKSKMNWQKIIRNAQKIKSEPETNEVKKDDLADTSPVEVKDKKFQNLAMTFQQKNNTSYRDYHSSQAFKKDSLLFLEKAKDKPSQETVQKENDPKNIFKKSEEKPNTNETSTAKATINTSVRKYLLQQNDEVKEPGISIKDKLNEMRNSTPENSTQKSNHVVLPEKFRFHSLQKKLDSTINISTEKYSSEQDSSLLESTKAQVFPTERKKLDSTININNKEYLGEQDDSLLESTKAKVFPTERKKLDSTININTEKYLGEQDDSLLESTKAKVFPTERKKLDPTININSEKYLNKQDDSLLQPSKAKIFPTKRKKLDPTINISTQEYLNENHIEQPEVKQPSTLNTTKNIQKGEAATVQTPKPGDIKNKRDINKEDPLNLIGTTLHRKFKIIDFLGQGGMGAVYLGENIRINQKIAIKILIKSAHMQQADIDRFNKEASIAAKIKHNNIVQVYDLDETERFHYIVMEYVKGKSIDSYMRENGILSVEESVYIIKNAALGFQVIHNQGVVHRDIKPANIMLTKNGEVKIMDFGIVKELGATVEITGTSTIIGTPQFMAPELISKTLIDHRSDIYSLGATLYFLLTGKYCFTGTPMQLMFQVINIQPIPPEEYNPKIPNEVSSIIMKMLEKQHIDRYQSMQEVYDALEKFEQECSLQ